MIKEGISSKRGKNRLKKHSNKLVTDTLQLLKQLLAIADESHSKEDIYRAFQAYIEIMPYIRPKLQAIAPAEMDSEGGLTALQVRRYAEIAEAAEESYRKELDEFTEEEKPQDIVVDSE